SLLTMPKTDILNWPPCKPSARSCARTPSGIGGCVIGKFPSGWTCGTKIRIASTPPSTMPCARGASNEGQRVCLRLVPCAGEGDELGAPSCRSVPERLPPVRKPDGRGEHERKLAEFGNRIQRSLQRLPRGNCSSDRRRCEVTAGTGEAATRRDEQ